MKPNEFSTSSVKRRLGDHRKSLFELLRDFEVVEIRKVNVVIIDDGLGNSPHLLLWGSGSDILCVLDRSLRGGGGASAQVASRTVHLSFDVVGVGDDLFG